MEKDEVTKALAKTYREIGTHWGIPEDENLLVLSIRGQRNEECNGECYTCCNYSYCFPLVLEYQRRCWKELLSLIIGESQLEPQSTAGCQLPVKKAKGLALRARSRLVCGRLKKEGC